MVGLITIFRVIGYVLLIVLPGAWISFGLPLKGLSFWVKLLLGIVLTPLVVIVEFYLIRLFGAPFGPTTVLLVIINLPALYLIIKQCSPFAMPDRVAIISAILVFAIILACLAPLLIDGQKRLYSWESWMQADIIYSLANGNLLLQDPDLAGVTLSYPWGGQIYQGTLSYLVGTPPVTNYIWLNLIWLIVMFGFAAGIVADLGGNSLTQVTVAIWLSFGVNFVGNILYPLIPKSLSDTFHVLRYIDGDNRFTPWLDKVIAFSQMYFGLGLFIAILYLLLRRWPDESRRSYFILTTLLLCGLGIIYSVLLPAAFAVVGARVFVELIRKLKGEPIKFFKELIEWTLILLLTSIITYVQIKLLSGGRSGAALVNLNDFHFMKFEGFITLVIMSPLLLGLGLVFSKYWKTNRDTLLILMIGGLASCALYVAFDIPWWRNEYKFIFTAAICLAPFPSLAMEPFLKRIGKFTLPVIALLTIILALPFAYKVWFQTYYFYTRPGPLADVSQFNLRLDSKEPLSGLLDTIRVKTPVNSILVLENTDIHYPTITQRELYVAPAEAKPKPGILVTNDELLTLIKGYPQQLIQERRATVDELFNSNNSTLMGHSFQKLLQFNRPLVLLIDEGKNAGLIQWLLDENQGHLIYQKDGLCLWLIMPIQN